MFIPVLDQLILQVNERFGKEQTQLLQETSLFSRISLSLKTGNAIRSTEITVVAEFAEPTD